MGHQYVKETRKKDKEENKEGGCKRKKVRGGQGMKGVKLTPDVDYLSMEDEDGPLGILIIRSTGEIVTIEDKNDFLYWYNKLTNDTSN